MYLFLENSKNMFLKEYIQKNTNANIGSTYLQKYSPVNDFLICIFKKKK